MYRAILYTDPHWSSYSSIIRGMGETYSVRLHGLIKSFNWIEDLARQYNADDVISLGDTFDKPNLNAMEISALSEINWSSAHHIYIVGNHESNVQSLEFSSTKVFDDAEIVDWATTKMINDDVDITMIPYITGDVPSLRTFIADPTKKNVVLAHQDLAGIQYGRFTSTSGFDLQDIIENCTVFLNGHLHNEASFCDNRIILLGNLTGQNFNEDASKFSHKAYLLEVEGDSISIQAFENPHAFNFYKIKIESTFDLAKLDHLKPNAVVAVSCTSLLHQTVLDKLNTLDLIESKVNVFYVSAKADETYDDSFKMDDHFRLFVDFAQSKLENTELLLDELGRLVDESISSE